MPFLPIRHGTHAAIGYHPVNNHATLVFRHFIEHPDYKIYNYEDYNQWLTILSTLLWSGILSRGFLWLAWSSPRFPDASPPCRSFRRRETAGPLHLHNKCVKTLWTIWINHSMNLLINTPISSSFLPTALCTANSLYPVRHRQDFNLICKIPRPWMEWQNENGKYCRYKPNEDE